MKLKYLGAAALMIVSANAATAQTVKTGKFGDATIVNGGPSNSPVFQLTSSGSNGFAGIYQNPVMGTVLSAITQLSVDYQITQGGYFQGSPRFAIFDTGNGVAYGYLGTPPLTDSGVYGNTGNYASLTSNDLRFESQGFGGFNSGTAPFLTFAQLVAAAGNTSVDQIALLVDGTNGQTVLANNFNFNGNVFSAAPAGAVPEAATWMMMIVGFGAVGFAMRRKSNVRTSVSYA